MHMKINFSHGRVRCTPPGCKRVHHVRRAAQASSQSCDVLIGVAQPEMWWPAADLHCKIFSEQHGSHASQTQAAGGVSKSSMPFACMTARVDRISALSINENLAKTGAGRTALLSATTSRHGLPMSTDAVSDSGDVDESLTGSSASSEDFVFPSPWFFIRAMVPEDARQKVGVSAEICSLVGVASLDSFGDLVPPRALDPMKDQAFGCYPRKGIAYLSNVAVPTHVRRQGIARKLVAHAEKMAVEWGCRSVGLHCNPSNEAAMKLYRSLGYRKTGVLEPPWLPYLNGRGPDRCEFMIKRITMDGPMA